MTQPLPQVRSFNIKDDSWHGDLAASTRGQDHIGRLFFTADGGKAVGVRFSPAGDPFLAVTYRSARGISTAKVAITEQQAHSLRFSSFAVENGFLDFEPGFEAQIERHNGAYALVLDGVVNERPFRLPVRLAPEVGQAFLNNRDDWGPRVWKTRYFLDAEHEVLDEERGGSATKTETVQTEVDVYEFPHQGLVIARLYLDANADAPKIEWLGNEITDSPELPDAVIAANPTKIEQTADHSGMYRSLT